MALSERRAHEDACGFARSRCALPFGNASGDGDGGDGDTDSCPMVVYRHEREKHRASCPYRLVPCSIPGCDERVRQNRLAQHVAVCDKKIVTCPNLCPWRGRVGELVRHRAACALETVACGREDTEWGVGGDKQRERCAYRAAEAGGDAAQAVSSRGVACRHCDALVCARRLLAHERVCAARRITCDTCGDSVLEAKLAAHVETECHKSDKSTRARCEFHRFGCAFSGSVAAMRAHAEEDAAKHLRLVALAVEASAVSYDALVRGGECCARRGGARDRARRARRRRRRRRVEARRRGGAQRDGDVKRRARRFARFLRDGAFEGSRVRETRARGFGEADRRGGHRERRAPRPARLETDQGRRRGCGSGPRGARRAVRRGSGGGRRRRRRTRAIGADVARIKESVAEAKSAVARGTAELERRIDAHERADGERGERVERELREHVVECVADLDAVAARQKALEKRWRASNETLRGEALLGETRRAAADAGDDVREDAAATLSETQSRWAATRAADGARYRDETEATEKENREGALSALSDAFGPEDPPAEKKKTKATKAVSGQAAAERQRGAHAAELLFGRGSRADPNVRARKL